MISLTENFYLHNSNGTRFSAPTGRIYIDQYRSRTMSTPELIKSAICHSCFENRVRVITRAIPREDELVDDLITNVINEEYREDIKIKLFCTARNTDCEQRLNNICNSLDSYHKITLAINNPMLRVTAYMDINKNMLVISNMMTDQLWFAIGAEYVEDAELKTVWATGNGTEITKYYRSKQTKELSEEAKKSIEDFTQYYKEGIAQDDPRVQELQELRNQYNELVQREENMLRSIASLERDIVFSSYVAESEKIEELKKIVTKMFMKGTLKNIEVLTNIIKIKLETPLVYKDEEAFKRMTESERANFYTRLSTEFKELFKDIFLTGNVKLIMINNIQIDKANQRLHAVRMTEENAYPNPHHYHFDCWGDYRNRINCALQNFNWDSLLMYLTAATAGINVLDTCVMDKMVSDLANEYYDKPILLTKDNNRISPKEYIKEKLING